MSDAINVVQKPMSSELNIASRVFKSVKGSSKSDGEKVSSCTNAPHKTRAVGHTKNGPRVSAQSSHVITVVDKEKEWRRVI